jgi:hypothetical protein
MTRLRGAALAAAATSIIVLAAACFTANAQGGDDPQAQRTSCDQPANHTILVGERVSCKEARVSKAKGNQITWRSESRDNLEIAFKPKNGKVPFPDLDCAGTSPVCNSGRIDPEASGRYDYDIWLKLPNGTKKAIDPGVVIDP